MQLGYVVLYVDNVDACQNFWLEKIGAKALEVNQVGEFKIVKIGLPGKGASLELVPKALMKDNPDNLDLATPSIFFYVADVDAEHAKLSNSDVSVAPVRDHMGKKSFAFSDNEGRWFAVMQAAA